MGLEMGTCGLDMTSSRVFFLIIQMWQPTLVLQTRNVIGMRRYAKQYILEVAHNWSSSLTSDLGLCFILFQPLLFDIFHQDVWYVQSPYQIPIRSFMHYRYLEYNSGAIISPPTLSIFPPVFFQTPHRWPGLPFLIWKWSFKASHISQPSVTSRQLVKHQFFALVPSPYVLKSHWGHIF